MFMMTRLKPVQPVDKHARSFAILVHVFLHVLKGANFSTKHQISIFRLLWYIFTHSVSKDEIFSVTYKILTCIQACSLPINAKNTLAGPNQEMKAKGY